MKPILLLLFLALTCFQVQGQQSSEPLPSDSSAPLLKGPQVEEYLAESMQYLMDRDLDGDGVADDILFDYSGGAHCCYYMALKLSTEKDTLSYPFQMDGGYMFGVDGSWPNKFRIEDTDGDGRMEIRMKIDTYNDRPDPWNKKWTRRYGIHQNDILFDYEKGEMVVRDDLNKPQLEE